MKTTDHWLALLIGLYFFFYIIVGSVFYIPLAAFIAAFLAGITGLVISLIYERKHKAS